MSRLMLAFEGEMLEVLIAWLVGTGTCGGGRSGRKMSVWYWSGLVEI